jgi:hypothetical protein
MGMKLVEAGGEDPSRHFKAGPIGQDTLCWGGVHSSLTYSKAPPKATAVCKPPVNTGSYAKLDLWKNKTLADMFSSFPSMKTLPYSIRFEIQHSRKVKAARTACLVGKARTPPAPRPQMTSTLGCGTWLQRNLERMGLQGGGCTSA